MFNRLMTVKKMSCESLAEVTRIIDEFSSIQTSLRLCNVTYEDLLVHIVQFRLDDNTLREWQKEIMFEDSPSFFKMMQFLTDYCSLLRPVPSNSKKTNFKASEKFGSSTKNFAASGSTNCVVCGENHLLFMCSKFKALTVSERYRAVNEHRLCRNCFHHSMFNAIVKASIAASTAKEIIIQCYIMT